jgi:hypothetical protein
MNPSKLFCVSCNKHTPHIHAVDQYITTCTKCGHITSQLDRSDMQSNVFITPAGSQAVVVKNDKDTVVFSVEEGKEAGYYVYDKNSGFGGIQKR